MALPESRVHLCSPILLLPLLIAPACGRRPLKTCGEYGMQGEYTAADSATGDVVFAYDFDNGFERCTESSAELDETGVSGWLSLDDYPVAMGGLRFRPSHAHQERMSPIQMSVEFRVSALRAQRGLPIEEGAAALYLSDEGPAVAQAMLSGSEVRVLAFAEEDSSWCDVRMYQVRWDIWWTGGSTYHAVGEDWVPFVVQTEGACDE